MKKYLLSAALLALLSVSAWSAPGKLVIGESAKTRDEYLMACAMASNAYLIAADMRNAGRPPNDALGAIPDGGALLPVPQKKQIINSVYFQPEFQQAWGDALRTQVYNSCAFGTKQFEPLK